ncbi:MAG: hypothetical protein HYZ22_17940 [Chloroflexi bacterium]|nr:hypothetical protein [Chloroflexota bacterium]
MSYRYKIPILLLIALAAFWTVSVSLPGLTLISGLVISGAAVLAYFFFPWKVPVNTAPRREYKKPEPPKSVEEAHKQFEELTSNQCQPQLGALNFMVTENSRALDHYFPIVKMLSEPEIESFYQLVQHIAEHPNFDIQLIGSNREDLTSRLPIAACYLVAGHLAETFFFRQNMLQRFLSMPRHFQLYTTFEAFHQDGGVKGGCYNPNRECIQLVLARLFEGFNGATPGVCPFLHELGHMLDHFDAGSGSMGRTEGLYPGLSPRDGEVFNPKARDLFIKGKRLELDRYLARHNGDFSQPIPIGSPYVFQNNGEFVAGYFEAFFRNPNYIASQNQDLFDAYVELFGCDPRKAWKEDFPNYVKKNREFYLKGEKPPKAGLTIPED